MGRMDRTEYDILFTKYDKHTEMHVENIQERHFLRMKLLYRENPTCDRPFFWDIHHFILQGSAWKFDHPRDTQRQVKLKTQISSVHGWGNCDFANVPPHGLN